MNLPVVIRDEAWKNIKGANLIFAEEVRQCVNKIETRQFDFGLRVKKLKGVSRIVWEARINRASRLLFTYRESNHSNGQNQKFIAVEAICIEHDDVSHQAKIIGRNWWEVEEIKVLGNLDKQFNQLTVEDQAEIRLWEIESIEIQAEFTDELLENIKWLILTPEIIESEEEWQNAIESGSDLRLRLTPDESKAIDTYGNILLSGSAGTGKTTVGLYRLARTLQINPAATCLYVAYNPLLVKEAEEQFKQLWGSTFESLPLKLDFLTIKDLCLKITKDFGERFDRRLVDYPHFYQRYIKKPESRQYPPSLLWDEIRSIIKGANLKEQSESYLLSEKEYQNLGKRRSGVIPEGERHKIYKLAQWYQQYLNHDNLVDEIDLTRAALQVTKMEEYNPYTLIVCDEVQDFTEIQLELLIGLIARGGQILCAGDINQMISPSGFRWEDLTTRLYQKNRQWTKENLPFNFRSTGQLVSLSVKLLKLKIQLLSELQPDEEVPRNITGERARLVEASKDDLKQINLGADDAILVRTEKRKQELNKTLATELIFTIEESKGLEFDTVYLIDFFENSKSLWSTALGSSKKLKERQKPELRLEFNLLYVAITRARRLLNICEAGISDLWKCSDLAENLISMSIDEAFKQAQSIDSQDWYKRAIYYRDAKLFAQALECVSKSGDKILKKEIEIELLLIDRKYGEAAQLLLEIKKYSEAAENFEKIEAWRLAENFHKKSECQIKYLLQNGEKQEAVKILISIEKYTEAAIILENSFDWKAAEKAWSKAGNQVKSLECKVRYLKDENQLEEAANLLTQAGQHQEAAEILELGKYWRKAAELWGELGDKHRQNKCLSEDKYKHLIFMHPKCEHKIDESLSNKWVKQSVGNSYSQASFLSRVLYNKNLNVDPIRISATTKLVELLLAIYCEKNSQRIEQIKLISEELALDNLDNIRFYQEALVESLEYIKKSEGLGSNYELEQIIYKNIDRIIQGKQIVLNKLILREFQPADFFPGENWTLKPSFWQKIKDDKKYTVFGYYSVCILDLHTNKLLESLDFDEEDFLNFIKKEFNVNLDKYFTTDTF